MAQKSAGIKRSGLNYLLTTAICVAVLGIVAAISGQTASAQFVADAGAWEKALEPLETMPVQDAGFVRSGLTFAQNHLLAIHDKRAFRKQSALPVILRLMADPQMAQTAPILKLTHPDLVELFGGANISAETYRNPAKLMRLREMIRVNQQLTRPVNETEGRYLRLQDLEKDFAIFPRDHEWLSPLRIRTDGPLDPADAEIQRQWENLKAALREDRVEDGAKAAAALADAVKGAADYRGVALPRLALDAFYNDFHPFAKSAFLYLIAALLYGAALLFNWRRIAWAGYAFLSLGFLAELFGIVARWILAGRAPLANMYESFVFATAGMILVALIFEATHRIRLAGLGGAILGFIFMTLAHKLPIFDSAIRPLMPALQSVWLAYHVVTIMLSYSAFALSFFVSVCYLGKDVLGGDSPRFVLLNRLPSLATLDVFNYKIIAVGFPLLTVGIILGAVWAETAWGRPWGFDPKETWSAITWLVYAVYLHVRFIGGWKGRRAAVVALIGFASVLFTYFGVNYLLPSLHSYVR